MKSKKLVNFQILLLLSVLGLTLGCSARTNPTAPASNGALPESLTKSATFTSTAVPIYTATSTSTPAPSSTATLMPPTSTEAPPTSTPTSTQTPTPAQPFAIVNVQAHCRYGPGVAYLHAGDLYPGDRGLIYGRNQSSTWVWFQPEKLSYKCWAATSTVDVTGDLKTVHIVTTRLPYSSLYGSPQNVQTARDGDQVTIAWDPLPFTKDDDRGYMLELTTCQGGRLSTETIQTYDTVITVTDEGNCAGGSGGKLWGVEKHGYTQPVDIPWP